MEYNREELEKKKLPELKAIAKNIGSKTTGKKAEIIGGILNNQPQPKPATTSTYFDILPGDINKMVNKYRIESDTNRKILEYLLYDTLTALDLLDYKRTEKSREARHEKLEKIFKDNGLEIYIVRGKNVVNPRYTANDKDSDFVFEWENEGPVSDQAIREILPIFAYNELDVTNYILKKLGSKFRIIRLELPAEGRKNYLYELVEINNPYAFGNIHKLS